MKIIAKLAILLAAGWGGLLVAAEPERVTTNKLANEQLLYFTSTSLLADDQHLVFIGDRTGHPNIYLRDLQSGAERQLSMNSEGYLKSYVYFDGQPYRGFGKASVSVDPVHGVVYFLQGRQVCAVTTGGVLRVLAELPEGQMTAFTHVSADGARLCVPTTDAAAFDGPPTKTDARIQQQNLNSYLHVFDTVSGKELVCERVPRAWITHVQFSPRDSNLILYNHEWPSDCGIRRMWLFDGHQHIRLRTEGEGRSRDDWTCHEMWERDGTANVGQVKPDGSERMEIALPQKWNRYGHFTVGHPGELVSDGYFEQVGDPRAGHGAWICRIKADWVAGKLVWQPLCRSGSSWDSQDSHPHPIFNHAADAIYFTSDQDGKRAVWRVAVP